MTFDVVELYVWLLWLAIIIMGGVEVHRYSKRRIARAKQIAEDAQRCQSRQNLYPYHDDPVEHIEKSDSGNLL